MEKIRTFIAVDPGPTALAALATWLDRLQRKQTQGVKWAGPATLHFTLAFLAWVEAERLPAVQAACGRAAAATPPFDLRFGGLGMFPERGPGRVLWLGLSAGAPELSALQVRVVKELLPLGFPPEERAFVPHLTLARAREGAKLDPALARFPAAELAELVLPVRELLVMRSDLRPTGPIYTRLATCALGENQDSRTLEE